MLRLKLFAFIVLGLAWSPIPQAQEAACRQPQPVCDARGAVFAVSGFDPIGSAVRIAPGRLVTSRHVVADRDHVEVFLPDGNRIRAIPVPTDYLADIQLLDVPDLPPGPALTPAAAAPGDTVYTIGADIAQGRIRAYDPGTVRLPPADARPLARLHHSAASQPGNSGGALVDDEGRLVGITASGGEGRMEAVPGAAIAELQSRSGPDRADASSEIGAAIRICTLKLEEMRTTRGALPPEEAKALDTSCRRTGNRQYFDLAAQALGSRRMIAESVALFEASLDQDPNSLNARLGLAITYHLAGRYEAEMPHLKFLMQHIPDDMQVLRLAIQAGTWAGETAFAQAAFDRLKTINPNLAPAAERFLNAPPPRPPQR